MVLLMSEHHPLAALGEVPYHLLRQYPEIVHGDLTPVLPAEQQTPSSPLHSANRIAVYERGSQFDLLRRVHGCYMWVSPMPFEVLARELLPRHCHSQSAAWPAGAGFFARAAKRHCQPGADGAHYQVRPPHRAGHSVM